MATPLSRSFQNMKISDSRQPQTASLSGTLSRVTSTRDDGRMRLTWPSNALSLPRLQFYAYHIEQEWLVDFAKQHIEEDTSNWDISCLVLEAVQLLQQKSGFKELKMEMGYKDKRAPSSVKALDDGYFVPLLSVCTTADGASYYRRPTQAQIDKLTQLLGREPRWWIDYRPLEHYE